MRLDVGIVRSAWCVGGRVIEYAKIQDERGASGRIESFEERAVVRSDWKALYRRVVLTRINWSIRLLTRAVSLPSGPSAPHIG